MSSRAFAFSAILAALLGTPALSFIVARALVDIRPVLQRRVLLWLAGIVVGVSVALAFGVSTSLFEANIVLVCAAYAAFGVLALSAFRVRPKFLGVMAGMALSIALLLGLVFGAVGFVGVGLVAADLPPIHVERNSDQLGCHVYSFGNATTLEGGYDVTVSRQVPVLRFLEYSVHKERFTEPSFQPSEACRRVFPGRNG